jgi:hypothetical protein
MKWNAWIDNWFERKSLFSQVSRIDTVSAAPFLLSLLVAAKIVCDLSFAHDRAKEFHSKILMSDRYLRCWPPSFKVTA